MKPVTGKSLKIGIFLILTAILAIVIIVLLQSNHLRYTAAYVSHTKDVLYQSEKVSSAVIKSKVILRDYIITGDNQQMHLLQKSNDSILIAAKKLQALTIDNPVQQLRIDSLLVSINKNIELSGKVVSTRQKDGLQGAATLLENTGINYAHTIQQALQQIEDQENSLLAGRKETNLRSGLRLDNLLLWLIIILLALTVIIIQTVRLDFLALKKADKERIQKQDEITHLSKLVEQTNDAIFSTDKNLHIKSWNRAAEKLYGYTRQEAIGKVSGTLIKSPINEDQRKKILADLDKEGYYQTEVEYSNKKGETIFVLVSVTSIKTEDGTVTGYVSVQKDISERKKLEDQLVRLNEELEQKVQTKTAELTGIFERLTDAFVAFDKNWCYTYMNKKAGELVKRDPETMIGKNVWDEFPAAVGSATYEIFHTALRGQQYIYNTDYYGPLDLWQENHVYPSSDGISVFIKDITHQKKAEEKINRSNERFQLIADATNDAVWDWDLADHTIWWNKNYYTQYGYTTNDSTPVSSRYNGIHPDDRQRVTDGINHAIETRQLYWSDEYRFLKADGSFIFVLDRGNILYNRKKQPYRMVGAMVDLSSIKKAEEKIIINEKRFRALLQNSTDGLTLLDADIAVLDISPSGNKILGYSYDELIGKSRSDLIHPEDSAAVLKTFQTVVKTPGEIILLEHRHKMPDGNYKWLECSYNNLLKEPYVNAVVLNYRDITERKIAEDKVKTNEQMLSRAQEIGQFGSWEYDALTNEIKWSDSMYRIHGLGKETPVNLDLFFQLLHPDDVNKVKTVFRNLQEKEARFRDEYRFIKGNTGIRFALTTIDAVFEEGKFRKAMGVIQDITELKNAEETLRQSEARYRKAQLQGKLGHWEFDIANKALFLSDEIYSIYNVVPDCFSSGFDAFFSRIHPDDQPFFAKEFDAVLKGGKNLDITHRIIRKDGTVQFMHEIAELIKSDTGVPLRLAGMAQDITEQKLADENLRRSEHKYRLLFENNPVPMWMSSIPDLNIIDVNESALKQYGYTREEFLLLHAKDLRTMEDKDTFLKESEKAQPASGTSMQWRHKRKDGTIIHVEIFNYQITYEGMPVWLGLSIDITEKTKAEGLLKKSYEDMRELASHLQDIREEERAHIAREIHDELGQQLTGLKMDISWLGRRKDLDEKQRSQKIKEILVFIDGTVNTVRKLSAELRPSILDDLGLVEALEWWSHEFEKRAGITCSFTPPAQTLHVPNGLAIGLFRIYQESLTNVARHANASKVTAQLESENDQLVLQITDNGKGFDTSNAGQKKTLGLLGMKERTIMMGGSYEIKSQPGKGTTVTISAPFTIQHNLIPQ